MDPQATWEELLSAYGNQQFDDAKEAAENLSQWLARGGFPPLTIPLIAQGDELHRVIAQAVIERVLDCQH